MSLVTHARSFTADYPLCRNVEGAPVYAADGEIMTCELCRAAWMAGGWKETGPIMMRDDPTYPPRYYVPGSIGVGNFPLHVEVESLATPKAKAEAKAATVLEQLSEDELAYLYVLLHDGRGLTLEGSMTRLRKAGWR